MYKAIKLPNAKEIAELSALQFIIRDFEDSFSLSVKNRSQDFIDQMQEYR